MKSLQLVIFIFFIAYCSFGQVNQAKVDSLKQIVKTGEQEKKAMAYIDLAKAYLNSDSLAANTYYNSYKAIAKSDFEDSTHRKLIEKQISYLKNTYDFKESISVLKQAIVRASNSEDKKSEALYHQLITPNYFYLFHYDTCEYHLDKAIEIYTDLKDTTELGMLTIRKSGIQYATGNYEKAIEYAFDATELFKSVGDKDHLSIAYLQLGNIFYFLTDYRQAEQYYNLSLKAFENSENEQGYYQALSNLGLIKTMLGKHRESIGIQLKALKYFEKNFQELEIGNAYRFLSTAYESLNQLDSSEFYNEKAIASSSKSKYKIGEAQGYIIRAKIAFKRGQYNKALQWGLNAYEIADSIEHNESKKDAANELSKIYETLEKPAISLKYLKIANFLRDSLDVDEKELKRFAEKHRVQIEDFEYELLLAKEKSKLEQQKSEKQEYYLFIAIVIAVSSFILLLIGLLFLIKNKKLTKELASNQQKIKDELVIKESLLSEIHHRVKNNLQVISSMLSLQSQYIDDQKFQKIISDCKSRINSMSLIHESLYKRVDGKEAHFSKYIKNLIPRLIHTYQIDESKIKLKMDLEDIYLNLDESIPYGLIINEIVSNALKHAFPNGEEGTISITLKKNGKEVYLNIADNGVGYDESENLNNLDSFGFLLIDTLASQLEAKLTVEQNNGLSYTLTWISNS